jgi:hypothetical protein
LFGEELRSGSVHLNLRRRTVAEEAVLRRGDRAGGRGIASAALTIVIVIIVVAVIVVIVVIVVVVVAATRTVPCQRSSSSSSSSLARNERHRLRGVRIEESGDAAELVVTPGGDCIALQAGTPIAAVRAVDATRSVRVFFMAGSPCHLLRTIWRHDLRAS